MSFDLMNSDLKSVVLRKKILSQVRQMTHQMHSFAPTEGPWLIQGHVFRASTKKGRLEKS